MTKDEEEVYYHPIGPFYLESSRCLIGDSIITFDCKDMAKIRHCPNPADFFDKSYLESGVILKDMTCQTFWHAFLKINLKTHEPMALIAFESEYIEDSDPAEIDRNTNWDPEGHFKANLSMGIYDLQYFDDDDYIVANFPEKYGDKANPWYNYVTEVAEEALHQYSCDIVVYGVSMTNLLGDNLFTVSSKMMLGIYEKVGIKIDFVNCQIDDPVSLTQKVFGSKTSNGLVDYNLGEPIRMKKDSTNKLPVLPTGPYPTIKGNQVWSNYIQTSLNTFFDDYRDPNITSPAYLAAQQRYREERALLLGTSEPNKTEEDKEQLATLLAVSELETGPKINSTKVKEL